MISGAHTLFDDCDAGRNCFERQEQHHRAAIQGRAIMAIELREAG